MTLRTRRAMVLAEWRVQLLVALIQGRDVWALRQRLGLTVAQAAFLFGIACEAWKRWERGGGDVATFQRRLTEAQTVLRAIRAERDLAAAGRSGQRGYPG